MFLDFGSFGNQNSCMFFFLKSFNAEGDFQNSLARMGRSMSFFYFPLIKKRVLPPVLQCLVMISNLLACVKHDVSQNELAKSHLIEI